MQHVDSCDESIESSLLEFENEQSTTKNKALAYKAPKSNDEGKCFISSDDDSSIEILPPIGRQRPSQKIQTDLDDDSIGSSSSSSSSESSLERERHRSRYLCSKHRGGFTMTKNERIARIIGLSEPKSDSEDDLSFSS